jgi:DNA-binding response OmpR family regulator
MHTILIVDDEQGFLQILQVVLQRAGYKTVTALSAHDALRHMETNTVDLLILDDMMPQMSGSDLCMQLKSNPSTAHLPIIMHSAGLKVHDKAHIQRIGADAVLTKPSQPREIIEMVGHFLGAKV